MNPDTNTITCYALVNPDRRISAIKVIRALGPVFGGTIGLKDAKDAVFNIANCPITVTVPTDYLPIIRCALEAHFVTIAPETRPLSVSSLVTYPEPEMNPMPMYSWEHDGPECDNDGIPF